MTSVFLPESVDGFEWIQPIEESDFDAVYQLDGSSRTSEWTPIRMRALERLDDRGRLLRSSDIPWLGEHALVFRNDSYEAVREVLNGSGEFLELVLANSGEALWLFNVCRVIDALDEARSDVVRFPSSGRIMAINRHEFRPHILRGEVAFRVPQVRTLFLTHPAAKAIERVGPTGTALMEVWRHESAGG